MTSHKPPYKSSFQSSPPRPYKVLAVDDMQDNLFLMQAILDDEAHGYEVTCVDSGQAALDVIASSPPDLVLLDIMMPEMTGYEVTEKIRQNPAFSHIPILLITAHDDVTHQKALAMGASGFVRKPFEIDDLLTQVKEAIQKKSVLYS